MHIFGTIAAGIFAIGYLSGKWMFRAAFGRGGGVVVGLLSGFIATIVAIFAVLAIAAHMGS